jgi:P27 family predicted phage terminase small subunit
MKPGRKTQPLLLKQLHGNPNDHALPTDVPEGVGELWAPPDYFDDEQRAQWDYALENAPPGLLTATDREVLVTWVLAAVIRAKAAREIDRLGLLTKTKDGNVIQNPFLPILNRQALIMLRAGAEMGFSPSSRMAMAVSADEIGSGRYIGAAARPGRKDALTEYLDAKPDKLDS